MIEVKITCVPYGFLNPEEIAAIKIINTGDHPQRPEMGNYAIEVKIPTATVVSRDFPLGKKLEAVETFSVKDHKRDSGIGPLLAKIVDKSELLRKQ